MQADNQPKNIQIFHFNDVYEIEPSPIEPVGGAARFVTAVKEFRKKTGDSGLVLFSGDLFSPSTLSVLYKGEQMIAPINACTVDVACVGNHEFDYCLADIEALFNKCHFPWLCSNIFNVQTQNILANNHAFFIEEKNGIRVGIMGLAEGDWLDTITEIDMSIVRYEDFVKCGKQLVEILRKDQNCDLIIALTHMRVPNDKKLAAEVPEIDLILGGHDHIVICEKVNESLFIKSGSDFKDFGILDVSQGDFSTVSEEEEKQLQTQGIYIIKKKFKILVTFGKVTKEIAEDEDIKEHVDSYVEKSKEEMSKVIGFSSEPLNTTFSALRTQETNFGNFYTDVIRREVQADIVIINSGTIRSDCVFPEGPINYSMLNKALPFPDIIIVQELSGEEVIAALENGVSKYPVFDGRFPLVSGIRFTFDPKQPAGKRIVRNSVFVKDELLNPESNYSLATKWFVSLGKDGYDMFVGKRYLLDYENGLPHLQIMISFFKSLEARNTHHVKLKPKSEFHPANGSSSPNDHPTMIEGQETEKKPKNLKETQEFALEEAQISSSSSLAGSSIPSGSNTQLDDERLPPQITTLPSKRSSSSIVSTQSPSLDNIHFMRSVKKRPSRIEKVDNSGLVSGITLQDDQSYIVISPTTDGRIKILQ